MNIRTLFIRKSGWMVTQCSLKAKKVSFGQISGSVSVSASSKQTETWVWLWNRCSCKWKDDPDMSQLMRWNWRCVVLLRPNTPAVSCRNVCVEFLIQADTHMPEWKCVLGLVKHVLGFERESEMWDICFTSSRWSETADGWLAPVNNEWTSLSSCVEFHSWFLLFHHWKWKQCSFQ